MATITVTYTPQYAGTHRVCLRLVDSPANPYCCYVDLTASVVGTPKDYVITLETAPCASVPDVDPESCDPVEYEGFVQPTCVDEDDLSTRTAWGITFTPVPTCESWEVTCAVSGVDSIDVTNPGSGYDPMIPPAVTIDAPTGPGPVQATGVVIIGAGSASAGFIVTQGSGYTNGVYPGCPMTGGTGTGLKATVVITLTQISSITITDGGTGYIVGDTVAPDTGVVGVPAPAGSYQITISDYGKTNSVTITDPGDGYIVVPAVVFDAPGAGVTALGTAEMEACAEFASFDCVSADVDPDIAIAFLEMKVLCSKTEPVLAAEYDVNGTGNPCCTCVQYEIDVLSGTVPQIYYTLCDGSVNRDIVELVNQIGGFSTTVCAIEDSVGLTPGYEANVSISNVGPCV